MVFWMLYTRYITNVKNKWMILAFSQDCMYALIPLKWKKLQNAFSEKFYFHFSMFLVHVADEMALYQVRSLVSLVQYCLVWLVVALKNFRQFIPSTWYLQWFDWKCLGTNLELLQCTLNALSGAMAVEISEAPMMIKRFPLINQAEFSFSSFFKPGRVSIN